MNQLLDLTLFYPVEFQQKPDPMNDSILVVTQQEKEHLLRIRSMLDKINSALDELPSHIREHVKYEIEVFNKESEYMADMLYSIAD